MLQSPFQTTEHTTLFLARRSLSQPFPCSSQSGTLWTLSPRHHVEPLSERETPPPLHSFAPPSCSSASAGVHGMAQGRTRLVVVVGLPGARGGALGVVSVLILHIDAMRTADELQPMLALKRESRHAMPHAAYLSA